MMVMMDCTYDYESEVIGTLPVRILLSLRPLNALSLPPPPLHYILCAQQGQARRRISQRRGLWRSSQGRWSRMTQTRPSGCTPPR